MDDHMSLMFHSLMRVLYTYESFKNIKNKYQIRRQKRERSLRYVQLFESIIHQVKTMRIEREREKKETVK